MKILLVIGGGIAAYKSLELLRLLREREAEVKVVLTEAAAHFVTPLSASSLSGSTVYENLLDYRSEAEFSHIELARWSDHIVIAPATANLIARIAGGHANDLATAIVLAATSRVSFVPAMNVQMWHKQATQTNVARLRDFGYQQLGPCEGPMACGEFGLGRMLEPPVIAQRILAAEASSELAGMRALVTCGPTREAIDPVRFISNRSSGKQGVAIANELDRRGADVTLVAGPGVATNPDNMRVVNVETAGQMLDATRKALPFDLFVSTAAVADWRAAQIAPQKLKKNGKQQHTLELVRCPDILRQISQLDASRPRLVVGFAAETENLIDNASRKLVAKGCDWIVANDVGQGSEVFGGDSNTITLIGSDGTTRSWPKMSKRDVAKVLCNVIVEAFESDGFEVQVG